MTFDEIPQFTRTPNYYVEMGLRFLDNWIDEHVEDMGLQLNPDFQRGHVWTEEQQTKYIEFILRGGQSGLDLYFNHPGWMGSFKGDFVCVDGLQRITAIRKFLHNEVKAFGQYYSEFGGKINSTKYTMKIHINNLKTRKEVLQWYIEMNDGGTPHTKEEINRVKGLIEKEG